MKIESDASSDEADFLDSMIEDDPNDSESEKGEQKPENTKYSASAPSTKRSEETSRDQYQLIISFMRNKDFQRGQLIASNMKTGIV